jgi:ABC-2 type transport system permease protein
VRANYVITASRFAVKELCRMRFTLVLLFVIPTTFLWVVDYTTTDQSVDFVISSISERAQVTSAARDMSLVFTAIAAVGFLASFLALNLIQKDTDVYRRLVLCGFRASELMLSKLTVLVSVTTIVGIYVSLVLLLFFRPGSWHMVSVAFILAGYVYGSYGLLVGSLFKGQLEGILFIVLLANIDAGWLQNPVYYTAAQNTELIRRLPAFYPSQVAMVSAFAEEFSVMRPLMGSLAYGTAFAGLALVCFAKKMAIQGGLRVTRGHFDGEGTSS